MSIDRRLAICHSALWAAYGDALGFMTERTDARGLLWRMGKNSVTETQPWRRRIPGFSGPAIEFPAGSYSDDTQLRLCVARAIGADGYFDVEAFAKIELVIWQAYALGAGRASKQAAANLSRRDVNWFTNFYKGKNASYWASGGNGAAMRIQPHVWTARDLRNRDALATSILCDTVCTHGHPRAIAGAILHGWWLARVLDTGFVPEPADWYKDVEELTRIEYWVDQNEMLSAFWVAAWKQNNEHGLKDAMSNVRDELTRDIHSLMAPSLIDADYSELVRRIDGFDPKQSGSGTKTVLLAMTLAWRHRNSGVEKAVIEAANALGSDTDTVATMVGAVLGALSAEPPKGVLQDRAYIKASAERLYRIAQGEQEDAFLYPDLGRWSVPKTMLDAVSEKAGAMEVPGLGPAFLIDAPVYADSSGKTIYQWLRLNFDQSVLIKRRASSSSGVEKNSLREKPIKEPVKNAQATIGDLLALADAQVEGDSKATSATTVTEIVTGTATSPATDSGDRPKEARTLDEMTQEAIRSDFDEALIGHHLLEFAIDQDGIEKGIAYTAIILKAKHARLKKAIGNI